MKRLLGSLLAVGMAVLAAVYMAANPDKPVWALKFWVTYAGSEAPDTVVLGQGAERVQAYLAPTMCPGPGGREMHFVHAPELARSLALSSSAQVELSGRAVIAEVHSDRGVPYLILGNSTVYVLEQDGLGERAELAAFWRKHTAASERGGQ